MPYTTSEMARKCNAKYRASAKGRAAEQKAMAKRRADGRSLIDAAKSQPCADCGGKFPACCMDLHHLHGSKSFSIGAGGHRTLPAIRREIAKCIAVCANCHRARHTKKEGR